MKFTLFGNGRFAVYLLCSASTLYAQEASESDVDMLDPVVIIGDTSDGFEALGSGKLAGSYDIIKRDELVYEHPDDTLELFSKVPGGYFHPWIRRRWQYATCQATHRWHPLESSQWLQRA